MQFWLVIRVVKKRQVWVVIMVVKWDRFGWLLEWLKRGSFR